MSEMGLTRKKIAVRTKRGKVYQRSVMVRSGAKESLRKYGAYAFASGAASGFVGGGVVHLTTGYQPGPARPSLRAAITGSAASMITGELLNKKTRTGRRLVGDIAHMTPWGRAVLGATSVAGSAVGMYAANRARDWVYRGTDQHVIGALSRYAKVKSARRQ